MAFAFDDLFRAEHQQLTPLSRWNWLKTRIFSVDIYKIHASIIEIFDLFKEGAMAQDMTKVSLGTHYTPLGSHPECPEYKDQTPLWARLVCLVVLGSAAVLLVNEHFTKGKISNFYWIVYCLVLSIASLPKAVFNWKDKSTRYWELSFSALFIGLGLYFFFKP